MDKEKTYEVGWWGKNNISTTFTACSVCNNNLLQGGLNVCERSNCPHMTQSTTEERKCSENVLNEAR